MRIRNDGRACIAIIWSLVLMLSLLFIALTFLEWAGKSSLSKLACSVLLPRAVVQNGIAGYLDCFIDIQRVF
jgi:hypothetical protein